jgi:hypothetical protein
MVLCAVVLLASTAEARLFGRRGGGYSTSVSAGMEYVATEESTAKLYYDGTASLQEIAQERADAMAARGLMSHGIHTVAAVKSWTGVGVAEGIGCGYADDHRHVATCICGRRVVADAFARAANGMIYRVRFFR